MKRFVTTPVEVVLNETITRDDNYAGHWAGTAFITHHTYGRQVHQTEDDARRWNVQQKVLRPAEDFPVLRLLDTRTGLVRRVLGTSLAANAPHKTLVWVQREGEQGAQPWSADELMSTWHDLVAVDENGLTVDRPTGSTGLDTERAEVEALEENARREAAQAPRKLDIWLTKGVVLVDPMLEGDLMVFERWGAKGAEVRNQRTGVRHVVSQSYITTWRYIPRKTDEHQLWRGKEGGVLVRVVESRADAVRLIGVGPRDVPFWLSHEQLAEYFTWEPGGAA